jgi:hypothetical protein
MGILARELNQREDTVLCLQEIQQDVYIPILKKRLTQFPNQCYKEYLFAPMGGLVTASRLPFTHNEFLPFPNRGKWNSIGFADWALRKRSFHLDVDGLKVWCSTLTFMRVLGKWRRRVCWQKFRVTR